MTKKIALAFFGILLLFLFDASVLMADKYEITVGGWGLIANRADNLWGRGSRNISSLNSRPDATTYILLVPSFGIKSVSSGQAENKGHTDLYFNTTAEPGSISLGAQRTFKVGVLDVHAFYSLLARNWENPYVLYRTPTDTWVYGGRITYGYIMGTNFSVSYRVARTDVDNDVIGGLFRSLRQDGLAHTVGINYRYKLSESMSITPDVGFERGEFDGSSNSYNLWGGGLGFGLKTSVVNLNARVYGTVARFDKIHPIFAKTRDENSLGASLTATVPQPFGWKKYSMFAGINGNTTNSNITFFERYGMGYMIGLTYTF